MQPVSLRISIMETLQSYYFFLSSVFLVKLYMKFYYLRVAFNELNAPGCFWLKHGSSCAIFPSSFGLTVTGCFWLKHGSSCAIFPSSLPELWNL